MSEEFPSNARTQRPQREDRPEQSRDRDGKNVQRITTSRVITRKKPLRKRLLDAFRPEDGSGFVEYTLFDVLVPGIKDAVADASTSAIENALGVGGSRRRRRSSRDSGGYTSYNRMGSARPRSRDERGRDRDDDRRGRRDAPRAPEQREFILDSRVEAEEVIDAMFELISNYGTASLRDICSMTGEPTEGFTDEDWGWRDLRGARVHKVREGYLIDLPRPEPLD